MNTRNRLSFLALLTMIAAGAPAADVAGAPAAKLPYVYTSWKQFTVSDALPNDHVFIRIGGEAPYAFLERLGIRIVAKDVPIGNSSARAG